MQFQIPQFIETEDKIAGPLTLKQLLYLTGAGGFAFIGFFIFNFFIWFILTAIVTTLALSLAFIKYNGQPLIKVIFSASQFFWNPRLYIWKREIKPTYVELPDVKAVEEQKVLTQRKTLNDVSFKMPSVTKLWTDMTTKKEPIFQREKSSLPHPSVVKEKIAIFRRSTGEKEVARRVDYR